MLYPNSSVKILQYIEILYRDPDNDSETTLQT